MSKNILKSDNSVNVKLNAKLQKSRFQIIPSVYLLLFNDKTNQILLSQRFGTGFMDGYWSVPSGHGEENESIYQAIIRESKEELDLEIYESQLNLFHLRHHTDEARFNFYFIYTNFGKITNNEPNKCSELQWFDIHKLPEKIVTSTKEVIIIFRNTLGKQQNYNNIYTFTSMSEPTFSQTNQSKSAVQIRERNQPQEERRNELSTLATESQLMSDVVRYAISLIQGKLENYIHFPQENLNVRSYTTSSKTDNHKDQYLEYYKDSEVCISKPKEYVPNNTTRFPLPNDYQIRGDLHTNFIRDLILTKSKLKHILKELYSAHIGYRNEALNFEETQNSGVEKTFNGTIHGVIIDTIETYAQIFAIIGFWAKSESDLKNLLNFSITRTKYLSPAEVLSLATNGFYPHTLFCGLIPEVLVQNTDGSINFSEKMFNMLKKITNKGCPVKSTGIINDLGLLFLQSMDSNKINN